MKIYRFFRDLPSRIKRIESVSKEASDNLSDLGGRLTNLQNSHTDYSKKINEKISSFSAQLNEVREVKHAQAINSGLQADDHFFDDYYKLFEDKFRGSEELITQRLDENYRDLFKSLPNSVKKMKVVDVGSGRGELLRVMNKYGIGSIGVDLNGEMVDVCNKNGLESIQDDAIAFLRKQKDASLAGVTGIHIAEHLPFELLYALIAECRRTVAAGGFILFETPNPENVTVGSHTFWFDSSHIKPLPPLAFGFLAEYIGFSDVNIKRMRPISEDASVSMKKATEKDIEFIQKSLLGPVDYALIARP